MAKSNISKKLKEQIARAREKAREADVNEPRAKSARYDADSGEIIVELANGARFSFPSNMGQGLTGASPEDLAQVEVTPSGDGLQWGSLDVDLGLLGLIRGIFGTKAWMAEIGKKGGRVASQAKTAAARINGMKGGRPRKPIDIDYVPKRGGLLFRGDAWLSKAARTSPSKSVARSSRSSKGRATSSHARTGKKR